MNAETKISVSSTSVAMLQVLETQRAAFVAARPEPLSVRRDRLERLKVLLKENAEALCAAMSADFGNRSREMSMMSDIVAGVGLANYCLKNLGKWARPEKRHTNFPLNLLGARSELRYEPKGVIGIVSPWNFPVGLTVTPLAQALAAGNRAMIKPSEFTERTSETMAELFAKYFSAEEVAFVVGGPEVGAEFCALPFDHLLFTGATSIGKHVLHAAADNLVPVTLELGGKSPVIMGRSADVEKAAGAGRAGQDDERRADLPRARLPAGARGAGGARLSTRCKRRSARCTPRCSATTITPRSSTPATSTA